MSHDRSSGTNLLVQHQQRKPPTAQINLPSSVRTYNRGTRTNASTVSSQDTREGALIVKDLNFVDLVQQWLGLEPMARKETIRAAIVMQSFIQGLQDNPQAIISVKRVCIELHVDYDDCERWCRCRGKEMENFGHVDETFVLSIQHMQLPPFIESITKLECAPSFVYAYHNGHQTYAANEKW